MAFAQMEPFGGAVDDLRAGVGPAVALNMNRAEGSDAVTALEFFPWHQDPTPALKEQTPEELADKLRALLTAKAHPDEH